MTGATPEAGGPRSAALDGLRALAVTAVVLFHAGVGWLPGGFLGVDLFFVLSGYLITGLLFEEARRGQVDLARFWARRARRLLPALVVVVVTVVVVAAADGASSSRLRADALATLAWASNWRFVAEGTGYFAQQADPSALQHTWSLAIEEQFYLLWPLLLVLLMRWRRVPLTRAVAALAALGAAASVIVTAWGSAHGWSVSALYYRADTRAQALLVGAALATPLPLAASGRTPVLGRWLAAPALLGTGALWAGARGDASWLYSVGLPAAALASTALIVAVVGAPRGVLARGLSVWPLRSLGRISYGVYLWHWPVDLALTAERTSQHGPALLVLRIGATLALATASWLVVERPLRRSLRTPRVVLPSTLGAAAAAALLVVLVAAPPLPLAPALSADAAPGPAASTLPEPSSAPTPSPTATVSPAALTPRPSPRGSSAVAPSGPVITVTVLGDSVADSLGAGLEPVDGQWRTHVVNRGIVGCGIATTPRYRLRGQTYELAEACRGWEQTWAWAIAKDRPQVALVVLGRHEVWDGELDGAWSHVGEAAFDTYLAGRLDRAIVVAAAGAARVALATSPYFHGREAPNGSRYPENDQRRVDRFNALLRAAAARHQGRAVVVELGARSCPGGHYTASVDGIRIRSDGVHFSAAGARWLAPWLLPRLRAAAG